MNDKAIHFNPGEAAIYPHIAEVETLLGGVARSIFPDGTEQFQDIEKDSVYVYSPRLVPTELERFCEANLERYQAFYEENEEAIQNYERVPMASFWE